MSQTMIPIRVFIEQFIQNWETRKHLLEIIHSDYLNARVSTTHGPILVRELTTARSHYYTSEQILKMKSGIMAVRTSDIPTSGFNILTLMSNPKRMAAFDYAVLLSIGYEPNTNIDGSTVDSLGSAPNDISYRILYHLIETQYRPMFGWYSL